MLSVKQAPHLHKAIVPQEQGGVVHPQVEDTVMAGADADADAGGDELQALAALHSQHAPHSSHHNCAVAAAGDGGILQGSQGIYNAVMAVSDAQHAIRKVILPFGYCALADPLDVNNPTCTREGVFDMCSL